MNTLTDRRAALNIEAAELTAKLAAVRKKQAELKREDYDARGWKSCCRCYPKVVGDDGFCRCCYYSHTKGKTLFVDPDPFDDTPPPEPLSGDEVEVE